MMEYRHKKGDKGIIGNYRLLTAFFSAGAPPPFADRSTFSGQEGTPTRKVFAVPGVGGLASVGLARRRSTTARGPGLPRIELCDNASPAQGFSPSRFLRDRADDHRWRRRQVVVIVARVARLKELISYVSTDWVAKKAKKNEPASLKQTACETWHMAEMADTRLEKGGGNGWRCEGRRWILGPPLRWCWRTQNRRPCLA